MEKIRELNRGAPYIEPIRKWKEAGGKVVGWYCSWNYIPEEILWAAGILPVRVTGNGAEPTLEQADNYLHADSCSFSRSCLERAFLKQFDFLDGFVASSACDGTRRLADVWKTYIDIPLIYVVDVPWKLTDNARDYYLAEMVELKDRLERHFKVKIASDALAKSVELYNRTRFLLKELYDFRKRESPPIYGSEVLELLNLAVKMPRPEFNSLLEELLKERKKLKGQHQTGVEQHMNVIIQQPQNQNRVRLMLNGSILNNPDFLKGIEELGAIVVTDSLCNGSGYWWGQVEENSTSPLASLASYYFSKFPDPRFHPSEKRFAILSQIAREFRVEGVISQIVRFCAPLLFDQARFRAWLEREGISLLEMDIEYGMPFVGGMKTRLEAFLEMVRERASSPPLSPSPSKERGN